MNSIAVAFAATLLATGAIAISIIKPCNDNACPKVDCADPTWDGCCSICNNSNCKLRGCVYYGAFGPTWRPDPCTVCSCIEGKEVCTNITCPSLSCYGYPNMTRPHHCCPECDFGVARNECAPIPTSEKSLYVALGDESCQQDVVVHDCNKRFLFRDGKWRICTPKEKIVSVRMKGSRCPVKKVVYWDVKKCKERVAKSYEIPLDYDDDPDLCSVYVEP